MRQILHIFLVSCLWVFCSPDQAAAQAQQQLNAVSGQMLQIGITSTPQRPGIQILPANGTAVFRSTGTRSGVSGNDVLEYVASPGFYGKDTFLVQIWTTVPYPHPSRTQYVITVGPSIVTATSDYASTPQDVSVDVDVLANDIGTFGNLQISSLTTTVGGNSVIANNKVAFTPASGFTGIATLSYTVCDLLDVCDVASASITVYDPNPSNDTLSIQVPKNGEQVVLINAQGSVLTIAPANGQLSGANPIVYKPNANFVGTDEFQWTSNSNGVTYVKQVYVDVLNVAPGNQYVKDDEVFISKNTTAYINPRTNDVLGSMLSGFAMVSNPNNGSAQSANGVIVYTPNAGFSGIDEIRYRAFPPGYGGPAEYGVIRIYVSDLPPAEVSFTLETPKNTPLVLDYPIPFTNYSFGINSPAPSNGDAGFYPSIDSTIAGYDVSGDRLIIYNPAVNFVGTDSITANYCITTTGACIVFKIEVNVTDLPTPPGGWCVQECVWPGDTDNNGRVELADLLPIGECFGSIGQQRSATSPNWTGLEAPEWSQSVANFSNLKYIDADGNGEITATDTTQILANLGRYHKPYASRPARLSPLPMFIELPFDTLFVGDVAYFNLILGTSGYYAEDIYGFTYDLNYGTNFIVEGSQQLTYDHASWLNYSAPSISLTQDETFGELSTAFTLTGGLARTGYGRVAQFSFIVDEDLIGIRPSPRVAAPNEPDIIGFADFSLSNASVSQNSTRYQVASDKVSIPVARRRNGAKLNNSDLVVFPNPAGANTRIHLNGAEEISNLRVVNELGQVVLSLTDQAVDVQLDLTNVAAGIYFIEVSTAAQTLRKRLVKH